MQFVKSYLGESMIEEQQYRYFVVERQMSYGIEIETQEHDKILSTLELFTAHRDQAVELGKLMAQGGVTATTMCEIIDDYVQ